MKSLIISLFAFGSVSAFAEISEFERGYHAGYDSGYQAGLVAPRETGEAWICSVNLHSPGGEQATGPTRDAAILKLSAHALAFYKNTLKCHKL